MTSTKANQLLSNHNKLIKKYSWKIAKAWHIPIVDVLGESYLIFIKAIQKYDENRGIRFSTYLTSQLQGLTAKGKAGNGGFCWKEKTYQNQIVDLDFMQAVGNYEMQFIQLLDFKAQAKKQLSKDAFTLLNFIFSSQRNWKQKELLQLFSEAKLGSRIVGAWRELRCFWKNFCLEY
jgi:hypothetical protein